MNDLMHVSLKQIQMFRTIDMYVDQGTFQDPVVKMF
jgi:hypothetical protein